MSTVDAVVLVGVEGIGAEEHGKQEDDPGLVAESVPEAEEFGRPRGVFHQDNLAAILANDLVGVGKQEGEDCTNKHQDDKGSIGTVGNGARFFAV